MPEYTKIFSKYENSLNKLNMNLDLFIKEKQGLSVEHALKWNSIDIITNLWYFNDNILSLDSLPILHLSPSLSLESFSQFVWLKTCHHKNPLRSNYLYLLSWGKWTLHLQQPFLIFSQWNFWCFDVWSMMIGQCLMIFFVLMMLMSQH